MSNLIDFDEVLKIIKEKNSFISELFGDKKVSGTRIFAGSPYKRDVTDEVRFILKGGAQISFVGDDEQEDYVKIIGGKEKAQKSLEYLKEYRRGREHMSVVSELAADILTISLEKYINKLSLREKKHPNENAGLVSIEEIGNALGEIERSAEDEGTDKTKEKLQYLMRIKRIYSRKLDEIKSKLQSLKLQISDKSIITKASEDGGREIANMDSIQRLYDGFQSMRMIAYEYMRIIQCINDKIGDIRNGEAKSSTKKDDDNKLPDDQDEAR